MRWPFGPPHLTLKPSKKTNTNKKKKQKKRKKKKHKIPKNELFSYQSNFSFFLVGVQNFPFLTTWPKKRAPKKHYKNRGFSKAFFEKQICVTKRPFLDKKTQIQKFQLSFFCLFLLFATTKNTKLAETPIFIVF